MISLTFIHFEAGNDLNGGLIINLAYTHNILHGNGNASKHICAIFESLK